ncbi:2Fe-2S iron-sulfur cluster-binding protein [Bradyrhizobium sp.]|uniref:2Fe-2S iron-sulfur cluster-binding protein n=1 Tax=Bradyrhizobium sp. TaxID=376 RepID=UPI0040380A35
MMRRICEVRFNGERYLANAGDLLLDWALMNGVELPHDCRAGMCGACRVRLVEGRVFGGHEPGDDMIHACQARIVSDIRIFTEDVPDPLTISGQVADIVRLAPEIAGVTIEVDKPLGFLPGQFCKLSFRGFPARSYSPTYPLEVRADEYVMHFHIRRLAEGKVSAALGRDIRPGHRVKLTGPFGSAFLRRNHRGPIVLVAGGTGFAPLWSIAVAAITERPERELTFIVAARELRSLYSHAALCRLARFPNVTIIPVVAEPQRDFPAIRAGRPTDHLPPLSPDTVVYTSGAPAMTESVGRIARAAGARCYADPFVPTTTPEEQARARWARR